MTFVKYGSAPDTSSNSAAADAPGIAPALPLTVAFKTSKTGALPAAGKEARVAFAKRVSNGKRIRCGILGFVSVSNSTPTGSSGIVIPGRASNAPESAGVPMPSALN